MNMFIDKLWLYEDEIWMVGVCFFVLAIWICIMLMSFFMVTIKSAMEEKDEDYDFFTVCFLKYRDGKWQINLKNVFDENAAIKVRFGWIFLSFFSEWEIEGITTGNKSGVVKERASQNMKMVRRRIRRM